MAVFKISDKYGGAISHALWRADHTTSTKTEGKIEVDWDDLLVDTGQDLLMPASIHLQAFFQLEGNDCINYVNRYFILDEHVVPEPASTSTTLPLTTSTTLSTTLSQVSFVFGYRGKTLQLSLPDTLNIIASLSSNTDIVYPNDRVFPVDSSVDLSLVIYDHNPFNVKLDNHQWSIKKLFLEDDTELADQTNTAAHLEHTFSQIGLYEISVGASGTEGEEERDVSVEKSTELLIGMCDDDLEVILSGESFGSSTPHYSELGPVFNYVRPAGADVKKVEIGEREQLTFLHNKYRNFYEYKRDSSSKFIDIDIQNADKCFLDTEPTTERICPTCTFGNCSCYDIYEMREGLSPLPSCSGNALDMSTLDTDTTECTEDVFVVAASKGDYVVERTIYKYCPADQDFCYLGPEYERPNWHTCSLDPS